MFLAAEARGCVRPVALMAALTQGRNFLLRGVPKDVEQAREDLLGEEHRERFLPADARVALRGQGQLLARCLPPPRHPRAGGAAGRAAVRAVPGDRREGRPRRGERRVDGAAVRKCVLAGFSDHLAKRLDGGTLRCELVHNRGRARARKRHPAGPAARRGGDQRNRGRGGEVNVLLSLATAIEEAWLKELFPDDFYREAQGVVYDETGQARGGARERAPLPRSGAGGQGSSDDAPSDEAAALLTKEVLAGRMRSTPGTRRGAVDHPREPAGEWFPELEVNPITDADRVTLIEQICYGETAPAG
jgi:ATP-dependent helicase HrpB